MKPHSRRILLVMTLAAAVCAVYWGYLLSAQRSNLAYAEEQVRLRSARLAEALAVQVSTLFSGLAYLNSSLAVKYMVDRDKYFLLSVQTALDTFPKESIAQIAVANAQGNLVYSSLDDAEAGLNPELQDVVSIADRQHFLVHLNNPQSGTYVGYPVFGRKSQRWTIQVSHPLRRDDGEFLGVVVLSVSPDYISGYFREVFANDKDVASLLYADGTYLARSSQQDRLINQQVPPDRPFLLSRDQVAGEYVATPKVDQVERFYAWHRVDGYPLLVSIGLERAKALAFVRLQQRDIILRNAVASSLIMAFVFWVAVLVMRLRRDQKRLAESEERFKLALKGGELGAWALDMTDHSFHYDQAWGEMLGYEPGELSEHEGAMLELVHPEDRQMVVDGVERHVRGDTAVFESEHRMRHKDGHWVWVSSRGGVTGYQDNGLPARLAGTQGDITNRKTEARLREALFDNSAAEILLTHPGNRSILLANRRAEETFSTPGQPLTGRSLEAIHVDLAGFERFGEMYAQLRQRGRIQLEWPFKNNQGEQRWFSVNGTLLDRTAPDGQVIWTLLDTTERKQAEQNLADAWARLALVIENFPGGVLVEDEHGSILLTNQAFSSLLSIGCEAASLIGRQVGDLTACLGPDDAAVLHDVLPILASPERTAFDAELLYRDRVLQVSISPVWREEVNLGRLWVLNDITARVKRESDLNRRATTDALTGLANRAAFLTRLDAELAVPHPQGILLMADLDKFKRVNDTYGHAAGDEVLSFLAGVFQSVLRKDDLVGRLGGEEFSVLLPGVRDEEGRALAERVRKTLEASHIVTAAGTVRITISIGMARLGVGSGAEVLAAADAALYKAKRSGRNRIEAAWEM